MKKVSVVGMGEAGKYVVNKIAEEDCKTNTIYLSFNEEDKEECKADIIINIKENIDILKQVLLNENVYIINNLGDVDRNRINEEICSIIKNEGNNIIEICSYPCTFEGKRRMNSAIDTLEILDKELNKVVITDGDLLLKQVNRKLNINEFSNILYDVLYTNYKDIINSNKMQNENSIINFKEKKEEMKERRIEWGKTNQELSNICWLGFHRNKRENQ